MTLMKCDTIESFPAQFCDKKEFFIDLEYSPFRYYTYFHLLVSYRTETHLNKLIKQYVRQQMNK